MVNYLSFDLSLAMQIDGMVNGKICEQTMFCSTDVVLDNSDVALDLFHGVI
jgi:hypothetical protein